MLYFSNDFGELNIDGLIDTGALSGAIPEVDIRKILLAPHTILNEGPPPEFQIMVANGHLDAPIATVEMKFEVGDITFGEQFVVMTNPIPTTQQYHTRNVSRKPELSLLFNAIEKWRADIPKRHWTHNTPSRNHTATGKTNHSLGKITDLHRWRGDRNNSTLWHYPSANMLFQYSHKGNQMGNYAFWLVFGK